MKNEARKRESTPMTSAGTLIMEFDKGTAEAWSLN
jgi:hypothetical protein